MAYRLPNSRKSNFATERLGQQLPDEVFIYLFDRRHTQHINREELLGRQYAVAKAKAEVGHLRLGLPTRIKLDAYDYRNTARSPGPWFLSPWTRACWRGTTPPLTWCASH
jgi:hypothetical protein